MSEQLSNEDSDNKLPPSELGTLEYWESTYDEELNNFLDHGDEGENWFGEGITMKIIKWINGSSDISRDDNILDIGCGNGTLLNRLHDLDYVNLTGVDYSEKAIKLAESIAKTTSKTISFQQCDILNATEPLNSDQYKVIIDKGTYDAICLNPSIDSIDEIRFKYINFILLNLQVNGYFMITSCNWTFDELIKQFISSSGSQLTIVEQIKTPVMTFGGKSGNKVTSIILRK